MKAPYLALFDCDGTMVDSQANICEAMDRAFSQCGLPPPPRNATRQIVGLSLHEAMRALLPDGSPPVHTKLADHYRRAFQALRANGLINEPLYDGLPGLLTELDETGWLLGVATGKSDRGLQNCLNFHGLSGLFVTLQTADRHPSKPHPSMARQAMTDTGVTPERTVVVGDTIYDIEMAINAGIRAIGVSWGYHSPHALLAAGAIAVAETMGELRQLLEEFARE